MAKKTVGNTNTKKSNKKIYFQKSEIKIIVNANNNCVAVFIVKC